MTIAQTIRQQIGTDTWLAVSARDAVDHGDKITFRFGNRYGLPNYIEITYRRATDDYSVKAWRVHRNGCIKVLAECDRVYFDLLGWLVRDINNEAEFA